MPRRPLVPSRLSSSSAPSLPTLDTYLDRGANARGARGEVRDRLRAVSLERADTYAALVNLLQVEGCTGGALLLWPGFKSWLARGAAEPDERWVRRARELYGRRCRCRACEELSAAARVATLLEEAALPNVPWLRERLLAELAEVVPTAAPATGSTRDPRTGLRRF